MARCVQLALVGNWQGTANGKWQQGRVNSSWQWQMAMARCMQLALAGNWQGTANGKWQQGGVNGSWQWQVNHRWHIASILRFLCPLIALQEVFSLMWHVSDGQLLQSSWRGTLLRYNIDSSFHSQNKRVLLFQLVEKTGERMAVQKGGTSMAPNLCRVICSREDSALCLPSFLTTP